MMMVQRTLISDIPYAIPHGLVSAAWWGCEFKSTVQSLINPNVTNDFFSSALTPDLFLIHSRSFQTHYSPNNKLFQTFLSPSHTPRISRSNKAHAQKKHVTTWSIEKRRNISFRSNLTMNIIPSISTHHNVNGLTELQRYLDEVLNEARYHCFDLNESNVNVASITIDMKSLSDYLHKFSANLEKLLLCDDDDDSIDNTICCEIQNFIRHKTKALKTVVPYGESTINHSDWWGRTFKQITQNIKHMSAD